MRTEEEIDKTVDCYIENSGDTTHWSLRQNLKNFYKRIVGLNIVMEVNHEKE